MRRLLAYAVALIAVLAPPARAAELKDPREPEVRRLIERYFLSWSNQDLDRYGQCFLPNAAVQLLDANGALTTLPLGPFLQSQREAHRQAVNRLTETAETVDVRFEGKVARVVVYWKLVGSEVDEYGYDHFTLINAGDRWRIANLLFYPDPDGPQQDAEKTPAATDPASATPKPTAR